MAKFPKYMKVIDGKHSDIVISVNLWHPSAWPMLLKVIWKTGVFWSVYMIARRHIFKRKKSTNESH